MFIRSDATIQASILNMLCHVLQLEVNYCLLDAKGIFIGLIMKLIESIEMGMIRYVLMSESKFHIVAQS